MKYDKIQNFQEKLKKDPNLMPSSVKTYMKLIKELTNKYGTSPRVEELNEFIDYKCNNRQPVVKYAIKHYLNFLWRDKDYRQLVKPKLKPTKRKKTYLTKTQALEVINSIDNEEHRVVAIIQYFTGARASEAISILKNNIIQELEQKRIKINIIGKGGGLEPVYLSDHVWHELQPFYVKPGAYMFLNCENISEEKLRTKTETYYKKYYESLKKAALENDIEMCTHDLRRSFAQSIINSGVNIYEVQRSLRHKDISTTTKYIEDDPEKTAATMLKHQEDLNSSSN